MTCEEIRDNFSAFIDGELDQAGEISVVEHLEACAGCAARLEAMRETAAAARGLAPVELPDEIAERLHSRIDAELAKRGAGAEPGKRAPWWQLLTRPAFGYAVASTAVVALAVVVMGPGTMREESLMRLELAPATRGDSLMENAPAKSDSGELSRYTRRDIDGLIKGGAAADRLKSDAEDESKAAAPISPEAADIPSDFPTDDAPVGSGRAEDGRDSDLSKERAAPLAVGIDEAAAAAANGEPSEVVFSELGVFEGVRAWIVVLSVDADPVRQSSAAVSAKTGEVLYRTD